MRLFTDEQESEFEQIWVKENKDEKYGEGKLLSDDQYIDYHIWEDMNSSRMYKKHLPNYLILIGKNPNIIFHGGCLGCLSQRKHGIERCKGCYYFKFNANNPNLCIKGEDTSKLSATDLFNFLNSKD